MEEKSSFNLAPVNLAEVIFTLFPLHVKAPHHHHRRRHRHHHNHDHRQQQPQVYKLVVVNNFGTPSQLYRGGWLADSMCGWRIGMPGSLSASQPD